jgi:hypothetical protein
MKAVNKSPRERLRAESERSDKESGKIDKVNRVRN